jgi:hypothetical protein
VITVRNGREVRQRCRLNFVVTGEARSGTAVVQAAVDARPDVVCHGLLFDQSVEVRRKAHEDYFGPCKDPKRNPTWYVPVLVNPWQYVDCAVFDNPQRGEEVVGIRLLYTDVASLSLFDLFQSRYRDGDFCVIHVVRNPVACFVSMKQAAMTGRWSLPADAEASRSPVPVSLDPEELVPFCREHVANRRKVSRACPDALEIAHKDLVFDFAAVARRLHEFLELDGGPDLVPATRRLRNVGMRRRISNFDKLVRQVPSDVRELFSEDLY